jgi:hypothetical protein
VMISPTQSRSRVLHMPVCTCLHMPFTAHACTCAAVNIVSDGGHVRLSRLAGNHATVISKRGDISILVAYCGRALITSSGGDVNIGHANTLQAEHGQEHDAVRVSSGGGSITMGGVDGCARLMSSGGDIEVQVRCSLTFPYHALRHVATSPNLRIVNAHLLLVMACILSGVDHNAHALFRVD